MRRVWICLWIWAQVIRRFSPVVNYLRKSNLGKNRYRRYFCVASSNIMVPWWNTSPVSGNSSSTFLRDQSLSDWERQRKFSNRVQCAWNCFRSLVYRSCFLDTPYALFRQRIYDLFLSHKSMGTSNSNSRHRITSENRFSPKYDFLWVPDPPIGFWDERGSGSTFPNRVTPRGSLFRKLDFHWSPVYQWDSEWNKWVN